MCSRMTPLQDFGFCAEANRITIRNHIPPTIQGIETLLDNPIYLGLTISHPIRLNMSAFAVAARQSLLRIARTPSSRLTTTSNLVTAQSTLRPLRIARTQLHRPFSTSPIARHGHLDPPKPGEEYVKKVSVIT